MSNVGATCSRERLFEGVGDDLRGLDLMRTVSGPKVTHLKFARRLVPQITDELNVSSLHNHLEAAEDQPLAVEGHWVDVGLNTRIGHHLFHALVADLF